MDECDPSSSSVRDGTPEVALLPPPLVSDFIHLYLTTEQDRQIRARFESNAWAPNRQVLWTGLMQDQAQKWADERDMQTLTTALGSVKPRNQSKDGNVVKVNLSRYMKGASALFAWYISRGETVTMLCPPPPERFHPSGETNIQVIEFPILKLTMAFNPSFRIEMVHPSVEGAEDFHYQIWPVDETDHWLSRFGQKHIPRTHWRAVKGWPPKKLCNLKGNVSVVGEASNGSHGEHNISTRTDVQNIESQEDDQASRDQSLPAQFQNLIILSIALPACSSERMKGRAKKKKKKKKKSKARKVCIEESSKVSCHVVQKGKKSVKTAATIGETSSSKGKAPVAVTIKKTVKAIANQSSSGGSSKLKDGNSASNSATTSKNQGKEAKKSKKQKAMAVGDALSNVMTGKQKKKNKKKKQQEEKKQALSNKAVLKERRQKSKKTES